MFKKKNKPVETTEEVKKETEQEETKEEKKEETEMKKKVNLKKVLGGVGAAVAGVATVAVIAFKVIGKKGLDDEFEETDSDSEVSGDSGDFTEDFTEE